MSAIQIISGVHYVDPECVNTMLLCMILRCLKVVKNVENARLPDGEARLPDVQASSPVVECHESRSS